VTLRVPILPEVKLIGSAQELSTATESIHLNTLAPSQREDAILKDLAVDTSPRAHQAVVEAEADLQAHLQLLAID